MKRSTCAVLVLMVFAGCSASPKPPTPTQDGGLVTPDVDCFLPVTIDFGTPLVGTRVEREFTIENTGNGPQLTTIGMPSSSDFVVSPRGPFALAPSESRRVIIAWTPTVAGGGGTLQVQRAESCASGIISLRGQALERALRWDPLALDFGFVSPGMTATQSLAIHNDSLFIVELTALGIVEGASSSSSFVLTRQTPITLQPRMSTVVQVTFTPSAFGSRQGVLTFTTNVPMQPNVSVTLRGVGGGPILSVPSTLEFHDIPVGASTSQQLDLANVGTTPMPPDPRGNLMLGLPTYEVMPFNANTDLNEVLFSIDAAYDPMVGVLAGQHVSLTVTFTPITPGLKSVRLTIFTNDPIIPAKVVIITANAQ